MLFTKAALLAEHNEIVRCEKALHGGYEIKIIGDAFMLAFQSARDALNCAIGIQRAFSKRNSSAKPPIRVRIGLHTGELVREADDFFGRHVNFAARVGSKAAAGEILVSSLLRDVVEPSGEFSGVSHLIYVVVAGCVGERWTVQPRYFTA
jgi:class 3 adenylate cyclase